MNFLTSSIRAPRFSINHPEGVWAMPAFNSSTGTFLAKKFGRDKAVFRNGDNYSVTNNNGFGGIRTYTAKEIGIS